MAIAQVAMLHPIQTIEYNAINPNVDSLHPFIERIGAISRQVVNESAKFGFHFPDTWAV